MKFCHQSAKTRGLIFILSTILELTHQTHYCDTKEWPVYRNHTNATYVIGGLFPVHFKSKGIYRYNQVGLLWVEAMKFAIDAINHNNKLLPGVTLGYEIYDTCNLKLNAMEAALRLMKIPYQSNGSCSCTQDTRSVIALIGDASSASSIKVASLYSALNITQISYSSTSTALDSKDFYPSFLRTIPADNFQALTIVDLLSYFNWRYVNVVGCDDNYGRVGVSALLPSLSAHNICVALHDVYDINNNLNNKRTEELIEKIRAEDQATVTILWCQTAGAFKFIKKAEDLKLYGKTWIATEAYATATSLKKINHRVVEGMFGVIPRKMTTPSFENHLKNSRPNNTIHNPWAEDFWISKLKCVKANSSYKCPTDASLDFLPRNKYTNVIDSVYAVAHSLQAYLSRESQNSAYTIDNSKFLNYAKNVKFKNENNVTVSFDKNGNPGQATYSVVNLKYDNTSNTLYDDTVGIWHFEKRYMEFDKNKKLFFSNNSNLRPISSCRQTCFPGFRTLTFPNKPCCWTCIKCEENTIQAKYNQNECNVCTGNRLPNRNQTACIEPNISKLDFNDPLFIVLVTLTGIGFISIVFAIIVFICYRTTPIVRSINVTLSTLQLASMIALLLLPIIPFSSEQSKLTCALQTFYFTGVYSIAISVTFTKARLLLFIFKASKTGILTRRHRLNTNKRRYFSVFIITIIGICLCSIYFIIGDDIKKAIKYDGDNIEVTYHCGDKYGIVILTSLCYICLMAFTGGVYSFQARKLPDIFNEAVASSFSMFIIVLIWIMFVPIYYSTSSYVDRILVWCLHSLVANLANFYLMYIPKVFIILFKPHENTKEKFRQKIHPRSISRNLGKNFGICQEVDERKHYRTSSFVNATELTTVK